MAAPQEQRIAVPIDDPNADTEWYGRADSQDALVSARANVLFYLRNEILRKHGVIPEKPPSPTPMIEEAMIEGRRIAHENRLEGKDLDELDELEDLEDDAFLESYKQRLYPVSKPEYQRAVTEASNNGPVFVNLTSSMGTNVESRVLSELWKQAAKEYGDVKFCEIQADKAIENYPDRNCPTILVYKDGDIVKQIVTLMTVGGVRMSMLEVDDLLVDVGAVGEKDMRVVKRKREAEDAKEEKLMERGGIKSGNLRHAMVEDDDDWE
ncbi:phosducin family protein [Apiospora kogelbergensis]|uniref:phosducin family protein n=1 Tax=Apiospora kogelbergensis TaxID=1337665 RepID=UPI00312DAC3B